MHQNTKPKKLCLTAEKKFVMPVLAAFRNKNFSMPVTHRAACQIERNGTVGILALFAQLFPDFGLKFIYFCLLCV